ncbi:MAG: hypothetical protein GY803_08315, partial [Chloroflexi bacterium]|nr:hypothetical protein [Chloroflexota bacterium]
MSTVLKWLKYIALGFLAVILLVVIVAGLASQGSDPVLADHGAGANSVDPAYSGLLREWPPLNEPADNPASAEKAELGRLLFFDPILSQNDDVACASCHHPDLGLADGRSLAIGTTGNETSRSAPSLWNAGYVQNLFWDGRTPTLEEQAEFPITHPDEMGVTDVDNIAPELLAVSEYADMFAAAFPGETIGFEQVGQALAAFQRTLISTGSPFDHYAAGEFDALTAQQRRGLALFRSGALRCFECHNAPTFANETFRVIGVESDDLGRGGAADNGIDGSFKVPTLRNIVLTAPYMHNGSMATLEEVVDFYADGGGRVRGVEMMDVFVQGFELSDAEKADLIAFLYALTDESAIPEIPATVPSGLPVVRPMDNPVRAEIAAYNVGEAIEPQSERDPMTIRVQEGESIQTAVDRARPGDTIEIPYGIYYERVVIDMSDITLYGVPNEAGDWPILDGEGKLSEGVLASGNNFTVGYLHVRNYTDNGVLVEGVRNVHFHDLFTENVGTYGVYPVQSTGVLIERVTTTGVDDAGIYAGQCEDVIVRDSVAYGNVLGIELENTVGGEVYDNHVYDNTLGILIVLLPQLTSKQSSDTLIYNNLIEANNHENFASAGVARVAPSGTGMLILASDGNEAWGNTFKDNNSVGAAVFSLTRSGAFEEGDIDVGPLPENNWIHDNIYENNGHQPDQMLADLGVPGADV